MKTQSEETYEKIRNIERLIAENMPGKTQPQRYYEEAGWTDDALKLHGELGNIDEVMRFSKRYGTYDKSGDILANAGFKNRDYLL